MRNIAISQRITLKETLACDKVYKLSRNERQTPEKVENKSKNAPLRRGTSTTRIDNCTI